MGRNFEKTRKINGDQTAEVTRNGGLVRESPSKSPDHSGFGIIVICPDVIYNPPNFGPKIFLLGLLELVVISLTPT